MDSALVMAECVGNANMCYLNRYQLTSVRGKPLEVDDV